MGDEEGTTAHGGNRRMGLADTELGLWAGRRPVGRREGWLVDGWQLEETGGCGQRTLGLMMGGGPADVAGFHHGYVAMGPLWASELICNGPRRIRKRVDRRVCKDIELPP